MGRTEVEAIPSMTRVTQRMPINKREFADVAHRCMDAAIGIKQGRSTDIEEVTIGYCGDEVTVDAFYSATPIPNLTYIADVEGEEGETQPQAVIDTASGYSIVSQRVAEMVGGVRPGSVAIRGVGGTQHARGTIDLVLKIGGAKMEVQALVTPDDIPVLIGRSDIMRNDITICRDLTVRVGGQPLPEVYLADTSRGNVEAKEATKSDGGHTASIRGLRTRIGKTMAESEKRPH